MKRTTLQTLIGCLLSLGLGAFAAFVLPHFSASPKPPSTNTSTTATTTERQIESPLAEAYRSATGAKRWLLLVSAAERASAAEMSTLIRIAKDDPAAIQMLAARWAELDPSGMFSSLYADYLLPANTPGALPSLGMLTDVLFEQWAKNDLPAAIRALTDAPDFSARDKLRRTVARLAMGNDVETALHAMSEWGIHNSFFNDNAIGEWAARDPRHAAETVLKFNRGFTALNTLAEIGKVWGKSDPAGGLRFAATLNPSQRARLGVEIMRNWAGTDLKSAAAFAAAQTDIAFRNSLAPGLVQTWSKSDPAAALAWSQENLKGAARTDAVARVIQVTAKENLTTASQLVSDMEPGAAQNRACVAIFQTWLTKGASEHEAAFTWLESLPDPATRAAAFEHFMWRDPEDARAFISGPHGALAPPSMILQTGHDLATKNPESAMEWVASLDEKRVPWARRAVLETWLQIRPEAATDYARGLPAGPERDGAIGTITQTMLWQSPEQAAAWIRSLPAAEQKAAREALDQSRLPDENRRKIEEALK